MSKENLEEIKKQADALRKQTKKIKNQLYVDRFKLDTDLRSKVEKLNESLINENLRDFVKDVNVVYNHINQYKQEPEFNPNEYLLRREQESIVRQQALDDVMGIPFPENLYITNEHGYKLAPKLNIPVSKITLLTGNTGAGKTNIAMNFMLYQSHKGMRVLYFTGEQKTMELWFVLFKIELGRIFQGQSEELLSRLRNISIFELKLLYNEGKTPKRIDGKIQMVDDETYPFIKRRFDELKITKDMMVRFIEKHEENITIIETWKDEVINDIPTTRTLKITEILQIANVLINEDKQYDCMYVDYLQLHKASKETERLDVKSNLDEASDFLSGFANKHQIAMVVLAQLSKSDSREFSQEIQKIEKVDSNSFIEMNSISGSAKPPMDCSMFLSVFTKRIDGELFTYLQVSKNRLTGHRGTIELKYLLGFVGVNWMPKKVD